MNKPIKLDIYTSDDIVILKGVKYRILDFEHEEDGTIIYDLRNIETQEIEYISHDEIEGRID